MLHTFIGGSLTIKAPAERCRRLHPVERTLQNQLQQLLHHRLLVPANSNVRILLKTPSARCNTSAHVLCFSACVASFCSSFFASAASRDVKAGLAAAAAAGGATFA